MPAKPNTKSKSGHGMQSLTLQPLQEPWVPPPARTSSSLLSDNMPSPLRLKISEMEALASLFADSGLSVAGDTILDSQHNAGASAICKQSPDAKLGRVRRKASKTAGTQKSRRSGPTDDLVRVRRRRRPTHDATPPSLDTEELAPLSPATGRTLAPVTGGRSCSGDGGDEMGQPASSPPRSVGAPPGTNTSGAPTDRRTAGPDTQPLLAGGGTLQEVLEKFLWAKQQASAAASLMSTLRQTVEKMDQDSSHQLLEPGASRMVPTGDSASAASTHGPAGLGTGTGGGRGVPGAPPAAVRAATHSSLLAATSCSLSVGGPARSTGSVRTAGSVSSTESVSVLPDESRSQLVQTATESHASRRRGAGGQSQEGVDADWRSGSASETGLPSQPRQLESLRRQFQRQQERLRRLEQTNYVLNLAVDGQDKTIRTLSTQLEDTKEALLQEISQQVAPVTAAAAARRRGGCTQTGPSLASVTASGDERTQAAQGPPSGGGGVRTGTGAASGDGTDTGAVGHGAPEPERPGLHTASSSAGRPAAAGEPTRQLVETGTSPAPEPEPRIDWAPQPPHSGPVVDAMQTGEERNRLEVQRLLAALDAKERELAALRVETSSPAQADPAAADQAFLSTPVPDVPRTGQFVDGGRLGTLAGLGVDRCAGPAAWPAAGTRARSTEIYRHRGRPPTAGRAVRRHSFTAPAPHDACEWRHRPLEPLRAQRSLMAEFDREGAVIGPPPTAAPPDDDEECERLQLAVNEGRTKIQRLEEEIFELKCAQRRQDNTSLEQTLASSSELKQQLASSVQQRQELQDQLTAAETAGAEQRSQLLRLREEVQSKEILLSRTSQHLEERIAQVAALGRELEAARSEAAREERSAAARLDETLARTSHLEEAVADLRQENKRLCQARDEAGQLAASERRLRQRVTELQERLDQSNNTAKMLENYIHFLKSSYTNMFGSTLAASPGASLASFDEHGASRSMFHLSGK